MKTLYEIKEDISVKYGFTQDISDKFAEMYLFGIEVTKEAKPEAKSQYNYWLKKLKEAKEKKYGKQAIERLEGIVNKYREVFAVLGIDLTNGIKSREDLNNPFENGSTIGIKVVKENGLSEKITHLSLEINKTNREKGFWKLYDNSISKEMKNAFISQALMLTVSELSEALEALRKGNLMTLSDYMNMDNSDVSFKKKFEENVKDKFEDELADAIIRCLDIAGGLGIDIGWHIENKLLYNSTR